MAKKKQKTKKRNQSGEDEKLKDVLEISQTATDVTSFIEKFKTDVKKRRKGYQLFAQKFQRKK